MQEISSVSFVEDKLENWTELRRLDSHALKWNGCAELIVVKGNTVGRQTGRQHRLQSKEGYLDDESLFQWRQKLGKSDVNLVVMII